MAEVAAKLPEGSVMQRWQVDAYADEPYCDNFRGVGGWPLHRASTSRFGHGGWLCTWPLGVVISKGSWGNMQRSPLQLAHCRGCTWSHTCGSVD
jgi:hypothetical protein